MILTAAEKEKMNQSCNTLQAMWQCSLYSPEARAVKRLLQGWFSGLLTSSALVPQDKSRGCVGL